MSSRGLACLTLEDVVQISEDRLRAAESKVADTWRQIDELSSRMLELEREVWARRVELARAKLELSSSGSNNKAAQPVSAAGSVN